MKVLLGCLLCAVGTVSGAVFSDGTGLFPVMVMVVDAKSTAPIEGVVVTLEGLIPYQNFELDSEKTSKVWAEIVGKPAVSNSQGIATVIYQGRWSALESEGKSTYGRSLDVIVVVTCQGKEIFRSGLKEWAEKNGYQAEACSVPLIRVEVAAN